MSLEWCRAEDKMKIMSELLAEAREKHYDNSIMVKKLRAMLQSTEDNARMLKKQSTFLSQLAAKTVPKGLHCFSMRLTVEYHMLPPEDQKFEHEERLEDPNLYHYALFSDNILAAAVVVNSTVYNAKVRGRPSARGYAPLIPVSGVGAAIAAVSRRSHLV